MVQPTVRIHFTDSYEGGNDFWHPVLAKLAEEYEIIHDSKKPDFLFFSCLGLNHRRYDCVKIQYLGENLTPDFNWCDYAVGFDYLDFEDRYLRYPLYWIYYHELPEAPVPRESSFYAAEAESKTGFCNFIYTNSKYADPIRNEFFDELSKYKLVDSGGKCRNNIGHCVDGVDGKLTWQRNYKFSIAFENSSKSGYQTEKLLHALASHTIPIYWGNPRVSEEFNVNRFINYHDYPSMKAVIERVRELDTDQQQYIEMLSQPWFTDSAPVEMHKNCPSPALVDFVRRIFAQGPVAARRVPKYGYTLMQKEWEWNQEIKKSFLKKLRNSIRKRKKRLKDLFSAK